MNAIQSIVINGAKIDPNHFAVKCQSVDELKRCAKAASEFLGFCGVSVEDADPNEYGHFGVVFSFDDGWRENGTEREFNVNGQLYCEHGNVVIGTESASEVKFQLDGYCIVKLAGDGSSCGGYFEEQAGTAFGRFLGQGLEFVDVDEVETFPVDDPQSFAAVPSGKSVAWHRLPDGGWVSSHDPFEKDE